MSEYIITKIEVKKNKVFIEIDGLHHLFLYETETKKVPYKQWIHEDAILTEHEMELLETTAVNRGKRRVMYLLAKQDYPRAQLESKLKQDGYSNDHIAKILMKFEEKGFINDERLAVNKVNQYKRYKSKREIEYVLRNKGFDSSMVKEAIKEEISEENEFESALSLVRKKFDTKRSNLEIIELKQKIYGFLGRKGFTMKICQRVIKAYLGQEIEEFFEPE